MKSTFSPSQAIIILILLFLYEAYLFFTWESSRIILDKSPGRVTSAPAFLPENPIDLNRADFYDLQLLPFIGPTYAARILEYRERQNGFKNIHELKNIQGITENKFEKLRAYVIVP